MGVVMPTLQAMANNVVEPQRRGAANATFITAFDIGIGGGSMLLGMLAEFTSLKSMYLASFRNWCFARSSKPAADG
jgi:predicted MFS family arabinose efflux permease